MSRRPPLFAALAGVGLIVLAVVGLILPKASAVREKQAEIAQARQQEAVLQMQLDELRQDAREAEEANARLAELDEQVPPGADLPSIIGMVNDAADRSDVEFMSIAPGQPTVAPNGQMSVIPADIIVSGPFFSVDQFLYELENLPRVAKVLSITAASSEQDSALQVTLSTNFFTMDTSAGPGSQPGPSNSSTGA